MHKVTSIEHALEVLGQPIDFTKFNEMGLPSQDVEPAIADLKIKKIIEAHNKLNGNWKADWSDSDQYKYSVWQWITADATKPSGFGFSGPGCGSWHAGTDVGSRLCVGSREAALYIGKDFIELFETAWLIIDPAQ